MPPDSPISMGEEDAAPSLEPIPVEPPVPAPKERIASGKQRRSQFPRESHADWKPAVNQIIEAHASKPVEPPANVQPGVPYDLERIIIRCLAKMPRNRYQDMDNVEKALSECACAGKWTEEKAAA
ncbi:MAG: hypothetical protein ACLP9L_16645 [Thermoguttaceae bacterium]